MLKDKQYWIVTSGVPEPHLLSEWKGYMLTIRKAASNYPNDASKGKQVACGETGQQL